MITGKTIALRAPEPNDADLLYEWENDRNTWSVSGTTLPYSKHAILEFIRNTQHDLYTDKQLRLMIVVNNTGECVGCIDLFEFDPQHLRAGIGILIAPRYRKKGFAGEALETLIQHCFEILGIHCLYANIPKGNKASFMLFRSLKFNIVGEKKDWIKEGKKWKSEFLLQRLNRNS